MSGTAQDYAIQPLDDVSEIGSLLRRRWGETLLMHGRVWMLGEYKALIARGADGETLGLATYALQKSTILVLTLDNFSDHKGIGKALLDALADLGREAGAIAIRVTTTNDNFPALRYFQLLGYRMVAFYPGAIASYRVFAPSLPEIGVDGIPVRDAIELEMSL